MIVFLYRAVAAHICVAYNLHPSERRFDKILTNSGHKSQPTNVDIYQRQIFLTLTKTHQKVDFLQICCWFIKYNIITMKVYDLTVHYI